MIPLLLAARELARAFGAVWRNPETKALPIVAGALVLTGTIFYWRFEDWSIIQALYFCIVTLTTVGYGDITPTSDGTQIFTIVYILTGFGVLVALLTSVAEEYLAQKAESGGVRAQFEPDAAGRNPTNSSAGRACTIEIATPHLIERLEQRRCSRRTASPGPDRRTARPAASTGRSAVLPTRRHPPSQPPPLVHRSQRRREACRLGDALGSVSSATHGLVISRVPSA